MTHDPIVEEVYRWREELLAQFHGDLHELAEHVRRMDEAAKTAGQASVSLPPKRPIETAKSA